MQLELLTPSDKLFSGEVVSVQVPGAGGQFQVLENHAPIVSALVKGEVKIKTKTGSEQFGITGGVIEVLRNKVIILAEQN